MALELQKQLAAAILAASLTACGGSSDGGDSSDKRTDPPVITDTTAPVITLQGNSTVQLTYGGNYADAGALASDDVDGNISDRIVIGGDAVNTSVPGTYTVTYNVSDNAGNAAVQVTRTVIVSSPVVNPPADTTAPVITLQGASVIRLTVGDTYNESGAIAVDNVDGNVSSRITISGSVNTTAVGTYTLTYNVSDTAGNRATPVTRTVIVAATADTVAPVLTLFGDNPVRLSVGDTYTENSAIAVDDVDGNISSRVTISGAVNTAVVGTYTITYNVSDAAGNRATPITRTVIVAAAADTVAPVLTLFGDNPVRLSVGDTYTENSAFAVDDVDGNISTSVIISGSVDTSTAGSYTLTYNVSDAAGNRATPVTRTVIVSTPDTVAPVITLLGSATVAINIGATYTDAGATASDDRDGDITANITVSGSVNTAVAGTYTLVYSVADAAGNQAATVQRTVTVTAQPPAAVTPVISSNGTRTLTISWTDDPNATSYQVYENKDGASGYVQIGSPVAPGVGTFTINAPLYDRVNASYMVSSCQNGNCVDSAPVSPTLEDLNNGVLRLDRPELGEQIKQDSKLGYNGSLSKDGSTLVIADANYAPSIGKVYVLKRTSSGWRVVWSPEFLNAREFSQPAVNHDGSVFVIGDPGFYGNRNDSRPSGVVYVFFTLDGGTTWQEATYFMQLNTYNTIGVNTRYGEYLAVSGNLAQEGDRLRLAVSAPNRGAAISTGGQTSAGRVYLYDVVVGASGVTTTNTQELDCPNQDCYTSFRENATWNINPNFGTGLALSADGSTLAVAYQSSEAEDVNIFRLNATDITVPAQLLAHDPINPAVGSRFGETLSLSADGSVLAISSPGVRSATLNVLRWGGAGYELDSNVNLTTETLFQIHEFGHSLSMTDDGRTLVVGAPADRSDGYGINADPSNLDTAMINSGAVYVFKDPDGNGNWSRTNFLRPVKKAPTDNAYCDYFGISTSVANDGSVAVGANNAGCALADRLPSVYLY